MNVTVRYINDGITEMGTGELVHETVSSFCVLESGNYNSFNKSHYLYEEARSQEEMLNSNIAVILAAYDRRRIHINDATAQIIELFSKED